MKKKKNSGKGAIKCEFIKLLVVVIDGDIMMRMIDKLLKWLLGVSC